MDYINILKTFDSWECIWIWIPRTVNVRAHSFESDRKELGYY